MSARGEVTQLPSDDLRNIIEQIASEVNIKDFEIAFRQQEFTGDNYSGGISRVQIIPNKGNNDFKTLHLIVKTAPTDEKSRVTFPTHDVYVTEIFAYTDLIPAFYGLFDEFKIPTEHRFLTATFYKGNNEDLKELIVLKDLSDDGFIMHDKRTPFDYDHAALTLTNMARIHAASFVMKEKHPEQFSKLSDKISHEVNFGEALIKMLENVARFVALRIEDPKNRAKVNTFVDNFREGCFGLLNASLSEPYNIICHGDSWNNNMLFKYNEDHKPEQVVFIDWQVVRLASPLTDMAYVFCLSSDRHLLDSHLDQLLELYYETLGLSMKHMGCNVEDSFPKSVFLEHFKTYTLFGLGMALGGLPIALCEPGYVKELADFNSMDGNNPVEPHISDLVAERVNGMVDFFVKRDLL